MVEVWSENNIKAKNTICAQNPECMLNQVKGISMYCCWQFKFRMSMKESFSRKFTNLKTKSCPQVSWWTCQIVLKEVPQNQGQDRTRNEYFHSYSQLRSFKQKDSQERGCHDSSFRLCTHIDMATRLILNQLPRDVLTRAAGVWSHLPVIFPISAWRMGEERCRGGMRHSSIRYQPCRFTYRQQPKLDKC